MTMPSLPAVGAAMRIAALPTYREWLLGEQRDLEIQDPINPAVLDGDWRPLIKQAREYLNGHTGRRGIHGPFDGLQIASRDPKVRAVATERLKQGLDFGAEIGATHMVVHSPFMFFGSPWLAHTEAFDGVVQVEYAHATLDSVVEKATSLGCTIVIEGIQDKRSGPLLDLIRSFNSPFVRSSIDVGHAYLMQTVGGEPPDQWVRDAGPLLEHLHLQDSDGQYDRHWQPGVGAINWFALFEALSLLAQKPRLIIEVRKTEAIGLAADYLVRAGYTR